MFWAFDPGHVCRKVAMVLEKVQVPPGELFKIMRLAKLTTMGAGEPGAPVGADPDMEFMWRFVGIEPLINDLPGLL
jgi:hypothetical protein